MHSDLYIDDDGFYINKCSIHSLSFKLWIWPNKINKGNQVIHICIGNINQKTITKQGAGLDSCYHRKKN